MQTYRYLPQFSRTNYAFQTLSNYDHNLALQSQNSSKMLNSYSLQRTPRVHAPKPYHLSFPTLYIAYSVFLPEGRAGTAWELIEK